MVLTTHRVRVVAATATLARTGAGFAAGASIASASDTGPQGTSATSPGTARSGGSGVTSCDGKAQVATKTRIVGSPFIYDESTGPVAVPGAKLRISGPRHGKDTLVISFSAETRLMGTTGNQDWQGLEVRVDGQPIQPYNASGDVLALNGEDSWGMHSGTFCTRIGRGVHTVKVVTNLADFDTDDNLVGWLDDYALSVERSK